ncbi:MAG: hypothetical protein GY861_12105, partial [bacterium]|nr:hypothetical protein [bacterium]
PVCLNCDEFKESWNEYIVYRKESKFKTYAPTGIKKKWAEISKWGLQEVLESIDNTMASGWQGIIRKSTLNNKSGFGNTNNTSDNLPPVGNYNNTCDDPRYQSTPPKGY